MQAVEEGGDAGLKLNETLLKLQEELVLLQDNRSELESQYGQQNPMIKNARRDNRNAHVEALPAQPGLCDAIGEAEPN